MPRLARMPTLSLAALAALAGCGRFGFDGAGDGNDAPDGSTEPACAFDLCDGFEAPTFDTGLWFVDPTVTRDTTVAHSGNASARMRVGSLAAGQGFTAALTETRSLSAPGAELWIRGWYRLSALPAAMNEMDVMAVEQTSSPFDGNYVLVLSDRVGFYSYDGIFIATQLSLPVDTWFCLLWHVRLSTMNAGVIELEGDLFDPLTATNGQTDGTPRVDSLRIGISFADANVVVPQPPLDVWVDDVIIHSAPVTCAD